MSDIYVEEMVQLGGPFAGIATRAERQHEHHVFDLLLAPEGRDQTFLIIGQAGSGKSTMLRNWTIRLTGGEEGTRPLPVYIALRHLESPLPLPGEGSAELARVIAASSGASGPGAVEMMRVFDGLRSAPARRSRRFRLWKRTTRPADAPQFVLLLDGFDELEAKLRPSVMQFVEALPPSIRVVLASRPPALHELNPVRSRRYFLCDFDTPQIESFAHQWFREAPPLAEGILAQSAGNTALRRVAAIPLLLAFLCIDVESRGSSEFPENLLATELLDRIVEIVIERWDASKSGRPVDGELLRLAKKILETLATEHAFGQPFSRTALAETVNKFTGSDSARANLLMGRLTDGNHLLVDTGEDGYYFAHSVFFDHFFARAVHGFLDGRAANA